MGRYVLNAAEHPPFGKAFTLARMGGRVIERPLGLDHLPAGQQLICVVKNYEFEAALVVEDENQLAQVNDPNDPRPMIFFLMPGETVEGLLEAVRQDAARINRAAAKLIPADGNGRAFDC